MELQHLKHKECPICGSRAIIETQNHKHTNGLWFESIEFLCGCKIEYIPNFRSEGTIIQCSKHPDIIKRNQKRKEAKQKLFAYIKRLDVDKEYQEKIVSNIWF